MLLLTAGLSALNLLPQQFDATGAWIAIALEALVAYLIYRSLPQRIRQLGAIRVAAPGRLAVCAAGLTIGAFCLVETWVAGLMLGAVLEALGSPLRELI